MLSRWGMIWMLLWLGVLGQQGSTPLPDVAELVTKLVANGQRYEAALPSLSCDESIVSQVVKKGKVKEEVTIEATMRVTRTGDVDRPFAEQHHFLSRNGRAVADGGSIEVPYFVSGGFANGLGFSSLERMACLDATLTEDSAGTLRVDMRRKANVDGMPACAKVWPGTTRTAVVDRASGHVTSIERSIPAEYANRYKEVPFARLDYAPQVLGSETFWLPVHGTMRDEKNERRMEIRYSGCKRFTGTSRIVGDVEKVPEP